MCCECVLCVWYCLLLSWCVSESILMLEMTEPFWSLSGPSRAVHAQCRSTACTGAALHCDENESSHHRSSVVGRIITCTTRMHRRATVARAGYMPQRQSMSRRGAHQWRAVRVPANRRTATSSTPNRARTARFGIARRGLGERAATRLLAPCACRDAVCVFSHWAAAHSRSDRWYTMMTREGRLAPRGARQNTSVHGCSAGVVCAHDCGCCCRCARLVRARCTRRDGRPSTTTCGAATTTIHTRPTRDR